MHRNCAVAGDILVKFSTQHAGIFMASIIKLGIVLHVVTIKQ